VEPMSEQPIEETAAVSQEAIDAMLAAAAAPGRVADVAEVSDVDPAGEQL
jgi:hypothetical protein